MGSVRCASCSTENPSDARFCNGCGARFEPARTAEETRRTVTVMFVDVAGSTALGERLDPEALRELIGRFFEIAKDVVERHGGIVEKFIGDAVMAVFGLPTLHEDDALRAVRASAELRERIAASDLAGALTVRTGVNTGEVVTGDPGTGQRLVTGDAVNVAARLEQSAAPGEILLGNDTRWLVRDATTTQEVEPLQLKGKSGLVRAYRLAAVHEGAEATTRRRDGTLVGRARELERLLRAFDDVVAERRCGLFTLLGPAGVGKSRLVYELTQHVAGSATVLRGRCLPYGEGITYWPIAEIVRGAVGDSQADGAVDATERLREVMAGEPDAREVAERLATAVGFRQGAADRDDVFRAFRRFLEAHARTRPVVVVVDDLQWAEPTLLDLIEDVIDWSRGAAILVVAVARPDLLDLRPTWGGGKLDSQTVLLEGLAEADVTALASSLLGGDPPAELLARIASVAEGNPLFVEQLIAMLVEDGRVVRKHDQWQLAGDASDIAVPPSIAALLAARLDRLPRDERRVAERASVVGRIFGMDAVSVLSPEPERPEVGGRLRSLVRRELIRPEPTATASDATFRFRHILIRDAAYESLSKRDRADLHERFANWLEATATGRLSEFEEILGHHLDRAAQYREALGRGHDAAAIKARASRHLAAAGIRALDRGDPPAAAVLLRRAVDLAARDAPAEWSLILGNALLESHRGAEAHTAFSEAAEAARRQGDAATSQRAALARCIAESWSNPSVTAADIEGVVADALPVLARAQDERGLAEAWMARGFAALQRSDWAAAIDATERAYSHAAAAGTVALTEQIATALGNALLWGPTPADDGLLRFEELLAGVSSHRARSTLLVERAVLLAYLDRFEEAWATIDDTRRLLRSGTIREVLRACLEPAEIARAAGDHQRAIQELTEGRARMVEVRETGVRSTLEGLLAVSLAWIGRDHEALEMSEASERNAASDDMASQGSWRAGRSLAMAHLHRVADAVALANEGVAVMARTDQVVIHADACHVLAEVRRLAGDRPGAIAAIESAIHLYESKRHLPGAARARAAREALATG